MFNGYKGLPIVLNLGIPSRKPVVNRLVWHIIFMLFDKYDSYMLTNIINIIYYMHV